MKCDQLNKLPPVVNEWQEETYTPDCKFFCEDAECKNATKITKGCPFNGKELPIKIIENK